MQQFPERRRRRRRRRRKRRRKRKRRRRRKRKKKKTKRKEERKKSKGTKSKEDIKILFSRNLLANGKKGRRTGRNIYWLGIDEARNELFGMYLFEIN